jgi:hypothetical protein
VLHSLFVYLEDDSFSSIKEQFIFGGFIVMNRRVFWQIPECVKFRTVFEDKETILGVDASNEHRLFRKDAGKICFTESEAVGAFVATFFEKEFSDESEVVCV